MGGKAISKSIPIPNELGFSIVNDMTKYFANKLDISTRCFASLGSLGKKEDDYGDLDIALDYTDLMKQNNLKESEVIDFIWNKLEKHFDYKHEMKNIGILSFGYLFKHGVGQIDLVLTNNLDWTKFMYFSPNLKKGQSKYKGLYRTELIHAVASVLPVEVTQVVETFNNEFNGAYKGQPKVYWKYTVDKVRGLQLQLKTVEGKTCKLKKHKTVMDCHVSKDRDTVIHILFGHHIKESDLETFEGIWDIINKKDFKWSGILTQIIDKYIEIITIYKKLPLPMEVKQLSNK